MIDKIDELIISALSQNSKQEVFEIWDFLKGFNYNLTEEEIESRISKLEEEDEIIKGYTITVDVKKIPHRVIQRRSWSHLEHHRRFPKDWTG